MKRLVSMVGRLVGAALVLPAAWAAAAQAPDSTLHTLARGLLRDLVRIDSTHAAGSTRIAGALAQRFLDAGFPREDVAVLAPAAAPNKGNLVVRLRGRGHARPVLYLCHLDVVEVRRSEWSVEPFELTERDGQLYGRGTIDMKGQVAAVAASLIRMKQQHVTPERDIIAAFTADEEAGGDASGIDWLLKEHRDLIDAAFVVNPDGGEAGMKAGRRLYVAVQTSEKEYRTYALLAKGAGGHSSRPGPDNAIYRLGAALDRLSRGQFPVHLTATTQLYFAGRARLEEGQRRADMLAVGAGSADAAALARLSGDVETNIMLRTTCVATMIEGGQSESALPEQARATVQCRVIPGESTQSVQDALRALIADPGIGIRELVGGIPSPESAPAPALIGAVAQVSRGLWPEVVVLPQMSPGASDSVYTRAAGMPSYGIDGLFDDIDNEQAHASDEHIGVAAYEDEVEFTDRLMRRLALQSGAAALP